MSNKSAPVCSVHWEVIIVGGGNAALCAAIEAAERGKRVLLLESAPKEYRGGNSRHTRNFRSMHQGPSSRLTDSYLADEYLEDLLAVTKGKTDHQLAMDGSTWRSLSTLTHRHPIVKPH